MLELGKAYDVYAPYKGSSKETLDEAVTRVVVETLNKNLKEVATSVYRHIDEESEDLEEYIYYKEGVLKGIVEDVYEDLSYEMVEGVYKECFDVKIEELDEIVKKEGVEWAGELIYLKYKDKRVSLSEFTELTLEDEIFAETNKTYDVLMGVLDEYEEEQREMRETYVSESEKREQSYRW